MFYTHLVYVYVYDVYVHDVYVYIFCHYLDFTTKILFLYSQISPKVRGTKCSNLPETLLIYLFFLEELIINTSPFVFKGVLVWILNHMIYPIKVVLFSLAFCIPSQRLNPELEIKIKNNICAPWTFNFLTSASSPWGFF